MIFVFPEKSTYLVSCKFVLNRFSKKIWDFAEQKSCKNC